VIYQPADSYIIFNDGDPDLVPIQYKLPDPPALELIDGYGLPPEQQKWVHKPMPPKLVDLQNNIALTASQKVRHLEEYQHYYQDELKFILTEWERRISGYWLFIKGKPYYISGDNYFYLQWWPIEGKPVQFRMRDRKWWLFAEMCDRDKNVFGFNYPKHRREGATTRVSCKRFLTASSHKYARCGVQSKDEDHAKEVHKVFINDIFKYHIPFWYAPITDGNLLNEKSIRFFTPDIKSHPDYKSKESLQSIIDFRNSGEKAYDGVKLKFLHNDECGKTTEANIKTRWEIQRQCLSEGSRIIGKVINTSTVDEMDKGGGRVFKNLCDQSHYHNRDGAGRTVSGLYNFFMPASEGFEGDYVDEYGNSIPFIDEYGFDRVDSDGVLMAYKYHKAKQEGYRQLGDVEGLIEYTRQFPLCWKDCWRRTAKECNFDLAIIDARLDYYNDHPDTTDYQRGYFMWLNNVRDGEVIWIPDKDGKFTISYLFEDPRLANSFIYDDGVKKPGNANRFVAGGDPYKFRETRGGKKSNGGGAVFMYYDSHLDATRDISDWSSNRFVCTYNYRPKEKNLYGEDMLMMCHYFGCQMFPEINVDFLWDYFENRGYGAYLLYPVDPHTGKVSRTPGSQTGEKMKEEIFREYQHYILKHGARDRHPELLEQCREIEDDMGDFDLFAAGGYALVAAKNSAFRLPAATSPEEFTELFPTFRY